MFKAIDDKVVLKLDEQESERSGILIPEEFRDRVQRGTVVGIASNTPDYIKEGTIAYIPEISGVDIEYEGVSYRVVKLHELYVYE